MQVTREFYLCSPIKGAPRGGLLLCYRRLTAFSAFNMQLLQDSSPILLSLVTVAIQVQCVPTNGIRPHVLNGA